MSSTRRLAIRDWDNPIVLRRLKISQFRNRVCRWKGLFQLKDISESPPDEYWGQIAEKSAISSFSDRENL
jgi:hypothetical protein